MRRIVSPIDGIRSPFGQQFGFSPLKLFAASEQGVWYDPSDLTTLYQDSAGTTPVTAVEQPVGLVLDKSKGLVLGAELVTNGDFSNPVTTGWTPLYSTLSVVSGRIRATGTNAAQDAAMSYSISGLTVGRSYRFDAFISPGTRGVVRMEPGTGFSGTGITKNVDSTVSMVIVATSTTGSISFRTEFACPVGAYIEADNISVRELPGNHASQSTSASRPVLSARYNLLTYTEQFDNAAWSKDSLLAFGSGSTINATTAPNGTVTADLITAANATAAAGVGQSAAVIAAAHTWSICFKPNGVRYVQLLWSSTASTNYANYDIVSGIVTAGTYTAATITQEANGFYRLSITSTINAGNFGAFAWFVDSGTAARTASFTGDGVKGAYIWGADLRVTNDGAGLPAYQRVAASTDYDTTGFPPYLKFDGVDDTLVGPAISNVISASAYEACVGARFNAVTTNSVNSWENQSLVADSAGYVGIGMARSTGAVGAYNFDGAQDEITVAMTPPATIVLQQRHSGGNLIVSTNGGAEVSTASGSTSALFGALQLLKAYISGFTNGRLYGAIIRNTAFTDAERTNVRTWMNNVTKGY
jgi:hypothetical protein